MYAYRMPVCHVTCSLPSSPSIVFEVGTCTRPLFACGSGYGVGTRQSTVVQYLYLCFSRRGPILAFYLTFKHDLGHLRNLVMSQRALHDPLDSITSSTNLTDHVGLTNSQVLCHIKAARKKTFERLAVLYCTQ